MPRYAIPALLLVLPVLTAPALAGEHRSSSSASSSSSANGSPAQSSSQSLSSTRNDHDDAREALRRGKAMPLTAILEIAARRRPGTVIEVHLKSRNARLIYQVEVLGDDGRRWQLKLDARDGKILSVEDD